MLLWPRDRSVAARTFGTEVKAVCMTGRGLSRGGAVILLMLRPLSRFWTPAQHSASRLALPARDVKCRCGEPRRRRQKFGKRYSGAEQGSVRAPRVWVFMFECPFCVLRGEGFGE